MELSVQERRLAYFKEKIKETLGNIREDLGELRYSLYVKMVDGCDNYQELREMAELEMQLEFIEYTRSQVKKPLTERQVDISDLNRVCYDEKVAEYIPDEDEEIEDDGFEAIAGDEDTAREMIAAAIQRMTLSMPQDEDYHPLFDDDDMEQFEIDQEEKRAQEEFDSMFTDEDDEDSEEGQDSDDGDLEDEESDIDPEDGADEEEDLTDEGEDTTDEEDGETDDMLLDREFWADDGYDYEETEDSEGIDSEDEEFTDDDWTTDDEDGEYSVEDSERNNGESGEGWLDSEDEPDDSEGEDSEGSGSAGSDGEDGDFWDDEDSEELTDSSEFAGEDDDVWGDDDEEEEVDSSSGEDPFDDEEDDTLSDDEDSDDFGDDYDDGGFDSEDDDSGFEDEDDEDDSIAQVKPSVANIKKSPPPIKLPNIAKKEDDLPSPTPPPPIKLPPIPGQAQSGMASDFGIGTGGPEKPRGDAKPREKKPDMPKRDILRGQVFVDPATQRMFNWLGGMANLADTAGRGVAKQAKQVPGKANRVVSQAAKRIAQAPSNGTYFSLPDE